MFTKNTKKKIHIFCEGKSERFYFEALKGNSYISQNYYLDSSKKTTNDLNNAIEKTKRLEIFCKVIYFYDSDTYSRGEKKINEEIEKNKGSIYFSNENFEDFLKCHKTKNYYRDKKPYLHRDLLKELKYMDLAFIKKNLKKPNKFKDFKTIHDFLIELFEKKI